MINDYKNQDKVFEAFCLAFSEKRLNKYLQNENSNIIGAIALYYWNIELSQALYPALQIFEIVFRNSLHRAIADLFKNDFWFDEDFLRAREKQIIREVKYNLKRQNKTLDPNNMVTELSLGFWTSLLETHYEHEQILWPKLLPNVFPHISKKYRTRSYLSKAVSCIRKLRNRVFHYEPIWYWDNLLSQYESLLYLIGCLSPVSLEYLKTFNCFKTLHAEGYIRAQGKSSGIFLENSKTPT